MALPFKRKKKPAPPLEDMSPQDLEGTIDTVEEMEDLRESLDETPTEKKSKRDQWRESVLRAFCSTLLHLTDQEERMFNYILDHGEPTNLPIDPGTTAERVLADILQAIESGTKVLGAILSGSAPVPTSPTEHKSLIRQVMWALYARSAAKGYPFIGGMIVLEDGGRLAEFLEMGGTEARPAAVAGPAQYYERPSSHFQERRAESLGMDFHAKTLRLPLSKRTLHFGTLADNDATFVKFEYYGFRTWKDQVLHSKEFVDVVLLGNSEDGFREGPSEVQLKKIDQLLAEAKLKTPKEPIQDPSTGNMLTQAKSGLYWARRLLEMNRIQDSDKKICDLVVNPNGAAQTAPDRTNGYFDNPLLRQGEEVIFNHKELTASFGATWPAPKLVALQPPDPKSVIFDSMQELLATHNTIVDKLNGNQALDDKERKFVTWTRANIRAIEERKAVSSNPQAMDYLEAFKTALLHLNQAIFAADLRRPTTTSPTAPTHGPNGHPG